MKSRAGKRKLWVGIIAAFWLSVGLAVPLLISFQGDEVQFDSSNVVAAPRDTFHVAEPIPIDVLARAVVSSGRLAIGTPRGEELTAEETAKLLASGSAMLVLDRGEVAIGQLLTGPGRRSVVDHAPLVAALKSGSFKALAIRNGTLVVTLPGGQSERLTQANAQVVPDTSGAVVVRGEGFWRGQRSQFSLHSEEPDSDGRLEVNFVLKASLIDASFEGTVVFADQPSFSGTANVDIKNAERLANALGRSWPIGTRVQSVAITGPFEWQNEAMVFDKARFAIDGNEALGTLSLVTGENRGVVSGTLAFETLDIAGYLPRGPTARDVAAWQWWDKLSSSLSGQSTPAVDADLRLSAGKLVAGDHVLGTAAATIALKDGRLAADVAEISFGKGRATGQLSIDFNRFIPAIRMRGQLEGIAAGDWFKALAGSAFVNGIARVKADVMANGADPTRIASDLKGRVELEMDQGVTVAIALDGLKPEVTANAPEPASEIVKRALAGTTRLGPVKATALIGDGVVELRSPLLAYGRGQAQLAARFDLLDRTYDVRVLALDGAAPVAAKAVRLPADTGFPFDAQAEAGRELRYIRNARLLSLNGIDADKPPAISLHPMSGYLRRLQNGLDLNVDITRRNGF